MMSDHHLAQSIRRGSQPLQFQALLRALRLMPPGRRPHSQERHQLPVRAPLQ